MMFGSLSVSSPGKIRKDLAQKARRERQTYRQTAPDRKAERQKADGLEDRKTDRHTDRQIDKQTNKQLSKRGKGTQIECGGQKGKPIEYISA